VGHAHVIATPRDPVWSVGSQPAVDHLAAPLDLHPNPGDTGHDQAVVLSLFKASGIRHPGTSDRSGCSHSKLVLPQLALTQTGPIPRAADQGPKALSSHYTEAHGR